MRWWPLDSCMWIMPGYGGWYRKGKTPSRTVLYVIGLEENLLNMYRQFCGRGSLLRHSVQPRTVSMSRLRAG
ncbi:hypothetical protein CQ018_13305 [Arthrobacter sp. MYb227]|nr:hypothetical protein CQ018_13305 [Arthrobacter sp. MYb227]